MGKSARRMDQELWIKSYGSRTKCIEKIIFCGKKDDYFTQGAMNYCKMHFANIEFFLSVWGGLFPEDFNTKSYDYLINFLSRWIFSENVFFFSNVNRSGKFLADQ